MSAPATGAEEERPAPPGEGRLRELIREIDDFPKPGIGFKDITPLLADPAALAEAVRGLAAYARPLGVDCVVAAEARGFLIELAFLHGRERLAPHTAHALLSYES